jgi:hypothetical protein
MQPPFEPKKSGSPATSFTWTHGGLTWRWRPNGVELEQNGTKQLIVIEPDEPTSVDQQKAQQHG